MPIAVCQQVDELLNLCCGYPRPAAFPAWKRDIFARQPHPKAGKVRKYSLAVPSADD
jgi:hypothetical protein